MKALIIGFGSIGKRHARVLSEQLEVMVEVVTKVSECPFPHYATLSAAGDLLRFDYFVIATETSRHYENLLELDAAVSSRIILVEKPLFFKEIDFQATRNRVFVGYNLRFHPALLKLREFLNSKKVASVNVHVGEYLPWWRPNTDYRNCYSAKRSEGGGVVFDISHEIDYIQWLFGTFGKIISFTGKISDLEIDSDDYSAVLGITENKTVINLTMDYLSMVPVRSILGSGEGYSLLLDLEIGRLKICNADHKEHVFDFPALERDYTYKVMHTDILCNEGRIACTLQEGVSVMKAIQKIYSMNFKEFLYET